MKNDLSYVEPGSTVFINVHAPVFNQTDKGGGNARDAEEFRQSSKDYNVHVFAGHTHFYENNQVAPTLYEHNIGAACGAWWAGHVNRCGAPNGYLVVEGRWSEREMALQGYGSSGRLSTPGLQAWGVQIGCRLCRRQRLGLGFRLARGMVGGRAEQRARWNASTTRIRTTSTCTASPKATIPATFSAANLQAVPSRLKSEQPTASAKRINKL